MNKLNVTRVLANGTTQRFVLHLDDDTMRLYREVADLIPHSRRMYQYQGEWLMVMLPTNDALKQELGASLAIHGGA